MFAGSAGVPLLPLFTGAALLEALDGLLPRASSAAEALPIELLSTFLVCLAHYCPFPTQPSANRNLSQDSVLQDSVSALGIYGPVVFVATVIGAEMVPLFPTQPLTIASGLLFGTPKVLIYCSAECTASSLMLIFLPYFLQQVADVQKADINPAVLNMAIHSVKCQQSREQGTVKCYQSRLASVACDESYVCCNTGGSSGTDCDLLGRHSGLSAVPPCRPSPG